MRKPTVESVLRLYMAVTGNEPPPELTAKIRAAFEREEAEALSAGTAGNVAAPRRPVRRPLTKPEPRPSEIFHPTRE